jgi:hypothetical protein
LLNKSCAWDKASPIFESNEIVMHDDLTDNDIVIRQINSSSILKRLLEERLTSGEHTESEDQGFNFPQDFYGDAKYWLRANLPMKLVFMIFLFLYGPQSLCLRGLLLFLSPFEKFNIVIQMKNKL